jgi:hypothetical protein
MMEKKSVSQKRKTGIKKHANNEDDDAKQKKQNKKSTQNGTNQEHSDHQTNQKRKKKHIHRKKNPQPVFNIAENQREKRNPKKP